MPLPPAPKRRGDSVQAASATPSAGPNRKKLIATSVSGDLLPPAAAAASPAAVGKARQSAAPAAAAPQLAAATPRQRAASQKVKATLPAQASATPAAAPASVSSPASAASASNAAALPQRSKRSASKARRGGKAQAQANGQHTRLFVLDTNVLLHDPSALFRFEEHDIYLPLVVLEELDTHKRGATEVARNGRQVSRSLDALVSIAGQNDLSAGLPLDSTGQKQARGKLLFQTTLLEQELPQALPQGKADNQILGVVHALQKLHPEREVILVSKDINMRVKARALGMAAEDYQNDRTLDDDELLYSGALALPENFWARQGKKLESWQSQGDTFYRVHGPAVQSMLVNQFVYYEKPGEAGLYAIVESLQGDSAVLRTLRDYTSIKHNVWGVTARNREQNFALNLLMNPEIDFVTITGTAGTGKTLLALAAGLTQVLDERRYSEIIMTRATVNVGEDIGFLPGTEEEKMGPWMGALDDNLEFLSKGTGNQSGGDWGRAVSTDLIRSRIKIKSMNFMRGRTFLNKWVIIDEAQNLTPKQMKTLITRAGPGSKIICMGNLAQIDTPYLTEGSSGLTYAVDRFKGWPYSGHITLARGERSRLADFASEVL
ncbi:phosphate starvation-inducible protein PhoH [Vandammella animalimorsus]|uniref:Phosphate starvation-inducible protein PhoH n=1 Tax=Vandammella animalimorsus TaxID=2029117 RepID=A0A2A2AUC5_9BURK|nr:PhoH family protein [Vandammella animalimorsus]PAT41282.1 phosphate starvation-inducible protein PhoH [Vandammella animalimorsus]